MRDIKYCIFVLYFKERVSLYLKNLIFFSLSLSVFIYSRQQSLFDNIDGPSYPLLTKPALNFQLSKKKYIRRFIFFLSLSTYTLRFVSRLTLTNKP